MIDWEAPTGGYLLQACFSTGIAAARGIEVWMELQTPPEDGTVSEAVAGAGPHAE